MEEKKSNYTWLWIILAFVLGLLLTCAVSAVVGGIAGYFAGQKAAYHEQSFRGPESHQGPQLPRSHPKIPSEPQLPEVRPPERFPEEIFGGALVVEVMPNSPAAKAGLRAGDIIVKIDGEPLKDGESLADRIMQYAPGDEITLEVTRGGRTRTLQVELGRHPDKGGKTPWLGIKYRAMPRLRIEVPHGD